MKRKDMSDKDFNIMITSELFAREIQLTIDDGSFENETLDIILNSIEVTYDQHKYKKEVYKETAKILKNEYDLDMEELKQICRKKI